MEVIFIIIIAIYLIKKYKTPSATTILTNNNFKNIELLGINSRYSLYKAEKASDFYAVLMITNLEPISAEMISTLTKLATDNHYHNKVIIYTNPNISEKIREKLNHFDIALINARNSSDLSSEDEGFKEKSVITSPLSQINTTHMDDDSDEAIKDGKKVNSIFGSLFGNKPTYL